MLSHNDSTYHHSVFTTWKWHPFATWTPSFIILVWGHHPLLGATVFPASRTLVKTENRNSVNNSGIGILCSKNSNGRLAFPAVAGLLVSLSGYRYLGGDGTDRREIVHDGTRPTYRSRTGLLFFLGGTQRNPQIRSFGTNFWPFGRGYLETVSRMQRYLSITSARPELSKNVSHGAVAAPRGESIISKHMCHSLERGLTVLHIVSAASDVWRVYLLLTHLFWLSD